MKRKVAIFALFISFICLCVGIGYGVYKRFHRPILTTGRCVPAEGFERNRENCLSSVSIFVLPQPWDTTKSAQPSAWKASGSGFVVSRNGFIVSAAHVFEGQLDKQIAVLFETPEGNPRWEIATLESVDYEWDIALLSVPFRPVVATRLGFGQTLKPGSPVCAITTLEGEDPNVFSAGSVNTFSTLSWWKAKVKVLMLDIKVAPGSSGGGVFNKDGDLVGMVIRAKPREWHTWEYALPAEYLHVFLARQVCSSPPPPPEEE